MALEFGKTYDGRYKILKSIAEGGEGTVFLAQDEKLRNHLVAIKACAITTVEDREDFEKEALILINSSYENMPRIFGIFETPDNNLCLVMDYIEGENLEQLRAEGELNEEKIIHWLSQISDTLNYLHNEGIFHGDIKPKNIIISKKDPNRAYLVDFGSAKVFHTGEENGSTSLHFSPGYTSPEQYQGKLDARSDIYTLGATLYTLLSGKIYNPLFTIKLRGPASKYFTVVSKSVMLSPDDRYQTARQFKTALQAGQYAETLPEEKDEPRPEKSRFPLGWLAVGGLGAVACLAGMVWLITKNISPPRTPVPPTVQETIPAQVLTDTTIALLEPSATETSKEKPTIMPLPSSLPFVTSYPTTTVSFNDCSQAAAGNPIDVTIPDDTIMAPGQNFTKTWRIQNAGICTWTNDFSFALFSGDPMGSPISVPLPNAVLPGQSIDISVNMVAPMISGTYTGNWKFRNELNEWFGFGPSGGSPTWVRIIVVSSTSTLVP